MPEHLDPSSAVQSDAPNESLQQAEPLRILSRSPHPYHHQNFELLEPSDKLSLARASLDNSRPRDSVSRDSSPTSDSGTEADDEHFLKGLPAPRTYLHKGLRGRNEVLSGTSTPIPSPAFSVEEGGRRNSSSSKKEAASGKDARTGSDPSRRNKILARRALEFLISGSLGAIVQVNGQVRPVVHKWRIELLVSLGVSSVLVVLYPIRLIWWGYWHRLPARKIPIYLPSSFDPAPLLYPPAITIFASLLIAVDNGAIILPNIILSLCSLPASLFPTASRDEMINPIHWLASCIPLFVSNMRSSSEREMTLDSLLAPETLVLLYPLHQYLCMTLHSLTTTSLLTAELQLLSVALIDVLLLSSSPQAVIMKAMLWVGGLDILVSCSQVVKSGIALARVPKWRFKRTTSTLKKSFLSTLMSWRRVRHDLFHVSMDSSSCSSCDAFDSADNSDDNASIPSKDKLRLHTATFDGADSAGHDGDAHSAVDGSSQQVDFNNTDSKTGSSPQRRHTLPNIGKLPKKSYTHTPSGRRKRSASSTVRAFFSLTQKQALIRKWLYALYVYVGIVAVVFVPHPIIGVKDFVQKHALHEYEPVGWALGYLFGDLPWFRWQVVSNNLERWICLPPRAEGIENAVKYESGWVQYLRYNTFGAANTRLLLCAYYLAVIGCGLIVVFRLSPIYEVDTRRKVFHFMMVAMFAPSIYIDPTFVALALSIVLALFLLLDLLRASQLPPLSKPLANFLAPYVDGRDLRGPVVISHIFLLIGCAIPLWLSLGSLRRTGSGYLEGWEVPTREVSMVSGVVCVGLGDAAASLIGRRWGHHKWLWGGGKSLEGSIAFAIAVFLGLQAAHVWLRVGGWPTINTANTTPMMDQWLPTVQKSGICAAMASLTEAVLTGGNDNVIVPVVLWTCVKSLGV